MPSMKEADLRVRRRASAKMEIGVTVFSEHSSASDRQLSKDSYQRGEVWRGPRRKEGTQFEFQKMTC